MFGEVNPFIVAAIPGVFLVVAAIITGFFSLRARGDRKATGEDRNATAKTRRHVDATTKSWLAILEDITVRLETCEEGRAQDGVDKGQMKRELARRHDEIGRLRALLEERDA